MNDISRQEDLYGEIIGRYLSDPIGKELFSHLEDKSNLDSASVMKIVFMHGACVDFANAIADSTGWPIYEIQWGVLDASGDCESLQGIHRVIGHPSGRYFDVFGWTEMETVLNTFNAHDWGYKWMGEVDHGAECFNVDYDLIKTAALALAPENCMKYDAPDEGSDIEFSQCNSSMEM